MIRLLLNEQQGQVKLKAKIIKVVEVKVIKTIWRLKQYNFSNIIFLCCKKYKLDKNIQI